MTEETKTPKPEAVPQEAKDHFGTARDEFKKGLDAMLPPEVKEHRQAAQQGQGAPAHIGKIFRPSGA